MEEMKKSIVFFLIFVFVISLRFIHLGADPPRRLDPYSIGHIGDPGQYVSNARNKVIFGKWKTDEWNLMYVTPISHLITYAIFRFFGVGIAQMNSVPALFSSLLLFLLYFILKKSLGNNFALLGVLLLGVNYQFTMFSRIAVRVMPMLFFTLLSIYFLELSKGRERLFYFLAGGACSLSFTVKGTFLLILPSIVFGALIHAFFKNNKNLKKTFTLCGIFILGMGVIAIFYFFFFYFPHKELFQDIARDNYKWLSPHGVAEALRNFWIRPLHYFNNMPVETILALIFLPFLLYFYLRFPQKITPLFWISGLWLISNYIHYSLIYYRPMRHAIPLIFPIVVLAVGSLFEFSKAKSIEKPTRIPFFFYPLFFLWLLFVLSGLFILGLKPMNLKSISICSILLVGTSFGLTFVCAYFLSIWRGKLKIFLSPSLRKVILSALILISLFFNLKQYFIWVFFPRFDLRTYSRDLGFAFEKMSIGGLLAPVMAMENKHEAHSYHTGYINKGKDFISKYRISHLIINPFFDEKKVYQNDFPHVMRRARLIVRYPIWKTHVELYELNPSSVEDEGKKKIIEGEVFFGEGGIPRYDEEASNRYAFLAEKKRASLVQSEAITLSRGEYEALFFLKTQDSSPPGEWLAKIDVFDLKKRRLLFSRDVYGRDFNSSFKYKEFSLCFHLERETAVGLRIYASGETSLWFDKVLLQRKEAFYR